MRKDRPVDLLLLAMTQSTLYLVVWDNITYVKYPEPHGIVRLHKGTYSFCLPIVRFRAPHCCQQLVHLGMCSFRVVFQFAAVEYCHQYISSTLAVAVHCYLLSSKGKTCERSVSTTFRNHGSKITQFPQSQTVRNSSGSASGTVIAQKYEKSILVTSFLCFSLKVHFLEENQNPYEPILDSAATCGDSRRYPFLRLFLYTLVMRIDWRLHCKERDEKVRQAHGRPSFSIVVIKGGSIQA